MRKVLRLIKSFLIKKRAIKLFVLTSFSILILAGCKGHIIGLLNPKGIIAFEERKLFFDTLALMLIVVLPVIVMSFTFVYHYQVSHRIKDYKPNWAHSHFLESLWWGIPCAIIFVLAILTWKKTYELDPFNPIAGQKQPPMLIQVIALPWKWLFIYPEQNIASVNYMVLPLGRQVEYWITADNVPMSAFFIPQLGSQIYAMSGMRTRLFLLPTHLGIYDGMNTQYNGEGFSDMHFPVHVVDQQSMQGWVDEMKKSPNQLTIETYYKLLKPSIADKQSFYTNVTPNLFENVINVYMHSLGNVHPRSNIT